MKHFRMLLGVFLCSLGLTCSTMAQTATAAQYMQAGNNAYTAKNYDQAIQYYQAATQVNPNYGAAYQGLGNCYYLKGDNSNALKNYEKAQSFDPNNASLNSFVQSLRAKVGSAPAAPAATTSMVSVNSSVTSSPKLELDLNAGAAFASGTTGFGGGLGGYYPLDKSFLIGAMANFYTFSAGASSGSASASASLDFLEVMAAVKYKFDGTNLRPYVFGGVGINDVIASESVSSGSASASASASEIDPMIAIGAGIEFPAGKDMNIFVQGKYSVIFVPGVTTTVASPYGGSTSVTTGGGTETYIPIEGGINFNL